MTRISRLDISNACEALVPYGAPIMVHSSLRSFGATIEDGAQAIIDSLLRRDCTVMVPSFTESHFSVAPPQDLRPPRNGVDYEPMALPAVPQPGVTGPFSPTCGLIDPTMGLLARTVTAAPGAARGSHPLDSFSALGPAAQRAVGCQNCADVYAPIRWLVGEHGWILLLGVDLNRMTALHYAEQLAGRRLFTRWARSAAGAVTPVQTGGCSEGFPRLWRWFVPHMRWTLVGASPWLLLASEPAVTTAARLISDGRVSTHCGDPDCLRCRDAESGGPPADGVFYQP